MINTMNSGEYNKNRTILEFLFFKLISFYLFIFEVKKKI